MKCPKCGKEVSDSAKFCPQCGNELKRIPSPTKTKKKSKFKWIALLILVVLVVLFCAVVKKWGNRNSDLNSDSNSDFSSNVDSDSEYLAAIENYAEVNDAVMELVASSDYETSDTSGKAEKVLELLAQLENDGQIADNSVNYNETARIITYQYADGVYGSVMLEKTANDIGGIGASSYVEEYDEDGLVKRTSNSVDFGLEGCPYEEQLSALILYGWGEGHDKELQILRDEQQKSWTDEYMETTIEEDCTVAKFRTELTGNDFITIQLHGYVYNEIPTIYLQELTPFSMRVANSLNIKKLSEEEKQYLDDLKANRIGTMCSADDSKYHYFILPEFFTYYYANNLLDNTIIWLGCCDGYRNDLLVRAFADCGAKSVLGCTESVRIAYNLFMQEAFVYMLLYGNTVDESLCFAKSIWGDNDQIFSTNYLSVEDTDPAEVRYYNGGNETLVTLTADAETELEKKSVNDVDFHDKLTELIGEYGVFNADQTGTMCEWGEKWFEPSGILSATILDFDSDGSEEMLLCIAEECTHYDQDFYHIKLDMYEVENGNIVQADTELLGAYIPSNPTQTERNEVILQRNYWSEEIIAVNAVQMNGKYYIMCENHSVAGAFADGEEQSYWMLEYVNGSFQYICSFTQTSGGSSDFAYTGYAFEDGICTKSDLYYSEWYEDFPLYTDFGQAITNFFGNYGIQLDNTVQNYKNAYDGYDRFRSILSPENDRTLIFELVNTMTASDWSNNSFEFSASLDIENDLLDNESEEIVAEEYFDDMKPTEVSVVCDGQNLQVNMTVDCFSDFVKYNGGRIRLQLSDGNIAIQFEYEVEDGEAGVCNSIYVLVESGGSLSWVGTGWHDIMCTENGNVLTWNCVLPDGSFSADDMKYIEAEIFTSRSRLHVSTYEKKGDQLEYLGEQQIVQMGVAVPSSGYHQYIE